MMRIFRKRAANTDRTVGSQLIKTDVPGAVAGNLESAPATFSNPFGLSQGDSAMRPVDVRAALQQGNGTAEESYAASMPRNSGAIVVPAPQDRSLDQPSQAVETMQASEWVAQPETVADMQENSTDRRTDDWEPAWPNAPELARDGGGASVERPQTADRQAGGAAVAASASEPRGQQVPLIRESDRTDLDDDAPAATAKAEPVAAGKQDPLEDKRSAEPDLARGDQRLEPQLQGAPKGEARSFEPEPELPKFSPLDSGVAPRDRSISGAARPAAETKLWEAFTPSRPKYSSRFFAGRRWALQRIITAVEEDQAHIVIFGPRGIGKTSLANVLAESASEVEYQVLRYPCGSNATFEEIFRGLLRSLSTDNLERSAQAKFAGVENLEQLLPEGEFGPNELTAILSQIKLEHAILIIDEFDRIESLKLKNQLAEAIKNISDASAQVTFIIIGIAHSLDELIGMHPSIQRHLVGIHLPLMSVEELERVVWAGEEASGIRFEDATRDMIVSFAKGLPYYAQLLSLHAGRTALKRGSMLVRMTDLREALEMVLRESDPLARASYEAATREETDHHILDVLFAAATAPFDDYGTFTVKSVVKMFVDSDGKKRTESEIRQTLEDLASQENSRLIETWPVQTSETRYAFVLQTMRQYVLLRQAARRGLM